MVTTSEQQLLQENERLKQRIAELESEGRQTKLKLSELDQLYRTAPIGLCFMDNGLRFVRINDRLADMNGHPATKHIGAHLRDVVPEIAKTVEPIYQRVIARGQPELDFEFTGRTSASIIERSCLASCCPVKDELGNVVGVSTVVQDITDRKVAEQALQESEKTLRTVVDHAPEAVVVLDADTGMFVDANENALQLFGLDRDALFDVGPLQMSPPTQPDGDPSRGFAQARIAEALAGRVPVFEWVHRSAKGTDIPCEVRLVRLPKTGRNLLRGSITDITERKQAQEALERAHNELELRVQRRTAQLAESEKRFELAVQGTSEGIWDWNILSDDEWWSAKYYSLLGYEEGEIDASHQVFRQLLHPDDAATALGALEAHLSQGTPYDVEIRFRMKSGKYRWFRSRGQAARDEVGNPVRMAGSIQDITDRKQTGTALRKSERRFRTIFEQAAIGMAVLETRTGRFVRSNDKYSSLLGYSREEFTGKTFQQITHPDDLQQDLANMQQLVKGKIHEFTMEKRYYRKDGSLLWVNLTVSALWDPGEEPRYHIAIIEDISERKQAEAQLRTEQQLLRRLIDLQEEERRMVAHDIHDGFVQDVVGAKMQVEAARDQVHSCPDAQKLLDVAEDLLARGVAEGRRMIRDLRPMVLDDSGIIEAIEHLLAEEQKSRGFIVAFAHDVQFDRLEPRLEGAVFRIVQEALNNVKRHGETNHAALQLTQDNGTLHVVVRDQGVGFDPSQVSPERFGLRGIRERARLFGGTARIESVPGEGTAVYAQLHIDTGPHHS